MMDDKHNVPEEYEAPKLTELGSFQKLTGYVGLRERESLLNYPRKVW
ncbi:keywimysin-related RiPP [Nonomuraea sp. H19]